MKKKTIWFAAFAVMVLATQQVSGQTAEQIATWEREKQAEQNRLSGLYSQAGNNTGNLSNTVWASRDGQRIDFGDGRYRRNYSSSSEESGTFRVSGSTVVFKTANGIFSEGDMIGSSMTVVNSKPEINFSGMDAERAQAWYNTQIILYGQKDFFRK